MSRGIRRWAAAAALAAVVSGTVVNTGVEQVAAASGPLCSGVTQLAAGQSHVLALRSDGAGWGFGNNTRGQLAVGSPTVNRPSPVNVPGLSNATAVTAGSLFTAAVVGGTVTTAGLNNYGQLGDGTHNEQHTLVSTGLTGVTGVDAGGAHVLALKSDGTVWSWGRNLEGELGDGTTTESTTPHQVPGLAGVVAIAAGWYHSMALKSDGTVWTWGYNNNGQLGDGTQVTRTSPVQVPGFTGVAEIDGGVNFSMARKSNGTVWTWGSNADGQLGNPGPSKTSPMRIPTLSGAVDVAAGSFHALAITSAGRTYAWGSNSAGQIGMGSATQPPPTTQTPRPANSTTPFEVAEAAGASAVAAGATTSYALRSGTLWAWGEASSGQLGTGATADSDRPVQAGCPTGQTTAPAYAVALAAEPPVAAPGTPVTLYAVANQDVGPSPYEIQIFDRASGVRLASCATGVTCTAIVTSPTAATKSYVAYIATSSLTMPPPFVQSSAETAVVWGPTGPGPWSSSCTAPTQTVADVNGVLIQVQQVSPEETWVCFRSSSSAAWVGGRLTVLAPALAAPLVSSDESTALCAAAGNEAPGPHPAVAPEGSDVVVDTYAHGMAASLCVDAGGVHRRVVITPNTAPPGVVLNLDGM